jgi:hypothetical protein
MRPIFSQYVPAADFICQRIFIIICQPPRSRPQRALAARPGRGRIPAPKVILPSFHLPRSWSTPKANAWIRPRSVVRPPEEFLGACPLILPSPPLWKSRRRDRYVYPPHLLAWTKTIKQRSSAETTTTKGAPRHAYGRRPSSPPLPTRWRGFHPLASPRRHRRGR